MVPKAKYFIHFVFTQSMILFADDAGKWHHNQMKNSWMASCGCQTPNAKYFLHCYEIWQFAILFSDKFENVTSRSRYKWTAFVQRLHVVFLSNCIIFLTVVCISFDLNIFECNFNNFKAIWLPSYATNFFLFSKCNWDNLFHSHTKIHYDQVTQLSIRFWRRQIFFSSFLFECRRSSATVSNDKRRKRNWNSKWATRLKWTNEPAIGLSSIRFYFRFETFCVFLVFLFCLSRQIWCFITLKWNVHWISHKKESERHFIFF